MKAHPRKQIAWFAIATYLSLTFGLSLTKAANIVVNSSADDQTSANAQCTLREALWNANTDSDMSSGDCTAGSGADEITFAPALVGQTINLGSELPIISADLTITGPGADKLTVRRDTGGNYRVFWIAVASVDISGLTITNGAVSGGFPENAGGGIFNNGTLRVSNCNISGNSATYGAGLFNQNNQTMSVTNCRIEGNTATQLGGGLYNNQGTGRIYLTDSSVSGNSAITGGGGIYLFQSPLSATNSTISGNESEFGSGGGIFSEQGEAILTGVTITNNRVSEGVIGGGLFTNGSGTFLLRDTIVSGNFIGSGSTPDDIGNGIDSASSHNLIGTGANELQATNGNQTGVTDPKLAPLAFNGGFTKTHALLSGSPAFDAGIEFTTISGSINATQTGFNVNDTRPFPGGVGFTIQVDDEQMIVVDPSGDTLNVTRGANGTTAAPHGGVGALNPAFDQRGLGYPRVAGNAIDIGAFEARAFVVNRTGDESDLDPGDRVCDSAPEPGQQCTLRAAIEEANTASDHAPITFAPALTADGPATISLGSELPRIFFDMTIKGPGAKLLNITRSQAEDTPSFRIFFIARGVTATIQQVTISNGAALGPNGRGGGILNRGTLKIDSCQFRHNQSVTGGGIVSWGKLDVRKSTFRQNLALSGAGVAVFAGSLFLADSTLVENDAKSGAAIYSAGKTGVVNSTFSANESAINGGAIVTSSESKLSVFNSTFSGNTAPDASDILISGSDAIVGNTIFKATRANSIKEIQSGNFTSAGYNLSSNAAGGNNGTGPGGLLNAKGDQRNTPPKLGPLANNSGPTLTHLPAAGGPAIDKGKNFAPKMHKDQRGESRTVRFDQSITKPPGGDGTDIGAVERQPTGGP